ncbi:MAG: acyl-CoA dehydrogenase, partial [Mycobacterium sp.]|nr:acyl-CoA dehydrogenase [Mycobacterium sp.]
RLYAKRYLAEQGPLRGIDDEADEGLDRFAELADGTLTPDYPQHPGRTIG